MRRFFVKNILFVLAVNLLIKPAWIFLIDRTVQNRVGHAAYGTYQALFNLGIIFQIILDFGLNNYNTRIISQNPDNLKDAFPTILSARVVLSAFYAVLVMITGWTLGYRGWELTLLAGVLMIQAFNVMVQYLRSNVAALQHFKIDGLLSVADRFLMILICGFLLWYPSTAAHFQIEWFVLCQIGCYGVAMILAFTVLRRLAHVPLRFQFNTKGVLNIVKESFPYALLIFLMSVYTRADMMLVERIAGKEQAGIYSSAFRLLDVGNIFGLMFANMLLPIFGRMLSEGSDIRPIIRLCMNMLLPISLIAAVAAFFYGAPIMHMLYPRAGAYDGTVFAALIASFPAYCVMYVYSTLLTARGDLKLLNKLALGGVVINLSLNFLLIPQQGALGAAITAFFTQSLLAAGFIYFAKKRSALPYNSKWIGSQAGFLAAVIMLCYGVHLTPLSWMLQLALYSAISLSLMFLFGFISVKALMEMFKKKSQPAEELVS